MKTWEVPMRREVVETGSVTVEAETAEEACEKAMKWNAQFEDFPEISMGNWEITGEPKEEKP